MTLSSSKRNYSLATVAFLFVASLVELVQGAGILSNYQRACDLFYTCLDKVAHDRVVPHWTSDGNAFWYRSYESNMDCQFYWVDAMTGVRELAFDHEKVALALGKVFGGRIDPRQLRIIGIESRDTKGTIIDTVDRRWFVEFPDYSIKLLPGHPIPPNVLARLSESPVIRYTGMGALITFINRTRGKILIESAGEEAHTLNPGGHAWRWCYVGQIFSVTTPQGESLGTYQATPDAGCAIVEGLPAPPATGPAADAGDASSPEPVSPDGKWVAFTRQYNVFVREVKNGEEFQITSNGTEENGYFDNPSQLINWSPDSKKLVVFRVVNGDASGSTSYNIEACPSDQLFPKLLSRTSFRVGDVCPIPTPRLFDIASRKEIPIDSTIFANSTHVHPDELWWSIDSTRCFFLCHRRNCKSLRLVSFNADTGKATTIIDDETTTFIDDVSTVGHHDDKILAYRLSKTPELIWMSERDGWNHLYLYDLRGNGRLENQITKGHWVVRSWDDSLDRVDEDKRQIYFRAGGLVPGQDPYYIHYCRINFDGSGLLDLTPGDGTHSISYSPDRRFYIDTYSRVDMPPITELRRSSDGSLVCALERGDMSALLTTGWKPPERFVAKGRDGKTDIYGVIYKPSNFDPGRKYPVVEDLYASPENSWVPKEFSAYNKDMILADLGFIVVQSDGMGTSNRSKAFHDVCWHNVDDDGLPDHIAWIKAAAATRPYMDLSRVGVYGVSAGAAGAVRALEFYNYFYKAAVAWDGIYDERMADLGDGEGFMGWPVGPWYAEQSDVVNAAKLQGKLFLIVDSLDQVVDPSCTMQMVNALINGSKDFDLLVVPTGDHGDQNRPNDYPDWRMRFFFVRNLLGVEPPPIQ